MSGDALLAVLGELAGAAWAGARFCGLLALLIVPAMVLYEVAAPLPLFAAWGRWLGPRLRRIGMSPACTVPLAAGLFLGVAYGAGFIIPVAERREVGPREIHSLGLFLSTCHAVIEDPLLFALVGAPDAVELGRRMAILVGVRLALALAVTLWHGRHAANGEALPA